MICIIYVSDVTFLSNQNNCESVTNLSYFFKFTNLRLFFNATDLVLNSNSMPVLCIHTRMQWLNSNWHILIRMCIWPKKSHPELDDLSKSIFTIHLISTHVFYTHCLLLPLRELRMDMRQKEDGLLTGTVASLQKLIYVNVKLDKKKRKHGRILLLQPPFRTICIRRSHCIFIAFKITHCFSSQCWLLLNQLTDT